MGEHAFKTLGCQASFPFSEGTARSYEKRDFQSWMAAQRIARTPEIYPVWVEK